LALTAFSNSAVREMFMMDGYTPSQFLSMADAVTSEARPVRTHASIGACSV
jgi:hypothetical protein